MFRLTTLLTVLFVAWTSSGQAAQDSVQHMLKAADAYRLTDDAMQVETQITIMKDGTPDKERRYTVYLRENRQSLVVMRSPSERGQKVLMLADDFWLIMPSTQRPMRITPTQKLFGDASTGDIATMTWAGDYDGKVVAEEACVEGAKERCVHLSLNSQRKGVTYTRIELWLAKGGYQPVRADLFVASDKMAKQASFRLDGVEGRQQVTEMLLTDQIQQGKQTVVRYLSRLAKRAPDDWFNPMFLTRNELGS
ncbi:MAG: outer membrane lipoprotein-sorting protein [Roseiflexaceae bacterium]|nr:outer membrane lipoprotein-sorting protein [Roseiflexaceae bacterium]